MAGHRSCEFDLRIVSDHIDEHALTLKARNGEYGAISTFVGITKEYFHGKKVVKLEYEAYESMAKKQLLSIAERMAEKYDIGYLCLHHRVGVVPPGHTSVYIAAAAVSRRPSLDAVADAIELVKAELTVWKKEVYEDGSVWKANDEQGLCKCARERVK